MGDGKYISGNAIPLNHAVMLRQLQERDNNVLMLTCVAMTVERLSFWEVVREMIRGC